MPSSITIQCKCGKSLHVGQDVAGLRIKCRSCGRTLEVRERTRVKSRKESPAWWQSIVMGAGKLEGTFGRGVLGVFRRVWLLISGEWRAATTLPYPARITQWLGYGYLVFAILLWVFLWGYGDEWWPATVLLFIGRWILLLPLCILIPAALIVRRKTIVPLTLATLIVLGPVMGFQTGWRRLLPRPAGTPLRVVTFNAEVGDAFAMRLPDHLEDWAADIVALQECGPLLRGEIRRLTGWHTHEEHGVCLLTRHPITAVAVMDRGAFAYMQEFDPQDIGGSADVVRYTIAVPGGPIDVTTVHLETPRKGLEGFLRGDSGPAAIQRLKLNTELRDVESSAARAWAERGNQRKLVIGDFNTPIESRIFQRHWGHFTDAFSEAGFGFGMTKDNGWIRVRIDHVLYGPGWHTKRAVVRENLGSDHRAVIADLVLEETKHL